MKKITIVLLVLLSHWLNAQVADYTFTQTQGTYVPISGGTVVAAFTGTVTAEKMDDVVYNLPSGTIPFLFNFDGTGYDGLNINSNGFVTFGATPSTGSTYTPLSSGTAYNGAISAFGRDLEGGFLTSGDRTSGSPDILNVANLGLLQVGDFILGTGIPASTTVLAINGSTITMSANATATATNAGIQFGGASWSNIQYVTEGVAPNRVFVIQFSNFKRFGTTLTTAQHMTLSFQIRLHELDNSIKVVYGNCSPGLTTFTTVNQVGLRGPNATFATNVNNRLNTKGVNDNWLNSIQGTTNTSGLLYNNVDPANVITSGLTYTWNPPPPCTGTPTAGTITPALLNICSGSLPGALVLSGFTTGVGGISFQWEQSTDGGANWEDVVGGSGATTTIYTPPAYAGIPIQYRARVICDSSTLFENSSIASIGNPQAPVSQVTNAGTNVLSHSSTSFNWTNGSGNRRVVYFSDAPIVAPVDDSGPTLVAATLYSGSGQQIIFDGTGTAVTVTGLVPATMYYVAVYEYLRCGTVAPFDYFYNISEGTNLFTFTTLTPPANDECSGAISLTVNPDYLCGTITPGTIAGATGSGINDAGCGGTENDDVWFSFVATETTHRISLIDLVGSTADLYHSLWTGADCNSLALVTGSCSDPNTSNPSGLTPGQTYYLRVYSWANAIHNTTFNVCIGSVPPPPLNDECSAAYELTVNPDYNCSAVTFGTIASASASPVDATACLGTENDDVWFSFVATANTHRISLINITSGTTDLYHSLWTGADCNSLTLVPGTCSDPNTSNPSGLVIGETYYLRVYSWTSTAGQTSAFDVCIGTDCPSNVPAPTGDSAQDFCDETLADLVVAGSNILWYDAAIGGNLLPSTTALVNGATYYASQTLACEGLARLAVTVTEDCPVIGCLTAPNGQWPSGTTGFTPTTCDGVTSNTVTTVGYAGEYSRINVTLGETYTFTSSVGTDFITISDITGTTAFATGIGSAVWISTLTGQIRFYTHLSNTCEAASVDRTRSIVCGVASTDAPDYVSLQWPPVLNIVQGGSGTVYGQVYEAGLTDVEPNIVGQAPGITAWVGISPLGQNTNPNTWTTWVPATWNAAHVSNNDEYEATIGATLAPGTYYYATRFRLNTGPFVYGGIDSNNQGNFWDGTAYVSGVLTVTQAPAPANDLCSGALPLTVGLDFAANATSGTILSATTTPDLTPSCQALFGFDVWYSVVVPSSGNLTVETKGATTNGMTDSVVAVYSGTCGALTQVGCDDDSGDGFMSLLNLTGQTPGSVLYVAVWKYGVAAPGTTNSNFLVSAYDADLSVGGFDSSKFSYYPNPVQDVLTLNYSQTISEVTVFNMLGQQVITKQNNDVQAQVSLSNLPNGTYLVRVVSGNESHIVKVIKN